MTTKIYYGRDLIGRFTCDGRRYTKWQLRWLKAKRFSFKVAMVIIALDVIGWALTGGYYYALNNVAPVTVWAEKRVEVPVTLVPPIMEKIAKCESGGTHYRNGQVVINATQDMGKYQINIPVWGKKAAEMKLDLTREDDNEAFAMYLYQTYGTEPWHSSANCWAK